MTTFEEFIKFAVEIYITPSGKKNTPKHPRKWQELTKSKYNREPNFAILTGKINNIIVIDLDKNEEEKISRIGFKALDWYKMRFGNELDTFATKSFSGGLHVFFKYDSKVDKNTSNKHINVDIRGTGGCIYQGVGYEALNDLPIRNLTDKEIGYILEAQKTTKKTIPRVDNNVILNERCKNLLDLLPRERYTDRNMWLNIGMILKKISNVDMWHYFSAKWKDYSKDDTDIAWNSFTDEMTRDKSLSNLENLVKLKNRIIYNDKSAVMIQPKKVNKMYEMDIDTEWLKEVSNEIVKYTPDHIKCLTKKGYNHSDTKNSCIHINQDGSMVANCFSCGFRVIEKKEKNALKKYFQIELISQENTVYQGLTQYLLEITRIEEYKREKGTGIVYRQIKPYAYIRYLEAIDFLNEVFLDDQDFLSNVNNMDNMIKFIKQINNTSFPFLEYDENYIGFSNGVLNKTTCEFTENPISGLVVKKFFDYQFTYTTETPLLDSVLEYQFDKDVTNFIYACLGRLFGIRDNFGFMLYLLGEPGCGKSLIIDIMCECFNNIGAIGSSFEEKFGLSFLYNKDLIVCDDLPKNISKLFPQQTFQTIITGGKIPISVKGGDGFTVDWTVPLLWAGNWFPDYLDKGQISRRMLIANFEKIVNKPDPTLKERIVKQELPAIIYKSILTYNKLLESKSNKDIWNLCPEYFLEQQMDMKMERNPLFKFLTENTVYKEGNRILMSELKDIFSNTIGTPIKKMDNGTFQQVDNRYLVERVKLCKHCNKKASKGCCDFGCHKDRIDRITVLNIYIL